MGLENTDSLAVLDALAPAPGWTTDVALLSSYSVDLVAAAAVIVALAGEGDDHERTTRGSLARACERLRNRVRVVCQAGRVTVPAAGAAALVLADRWIREVHHDGNDRSWHAKMALVRYVREAGGVAAPDTAWRLWIGSRNLTRDTSWDSALTAEGRPRGAASSVGEGIARAGGALAARAELPGWPANRVHDELRAVEWEWPKDVIGVDWFALWPDGDPAPGFPTPPDGLRELVAVSPFIDGTLARRLGAWGRAGTSRRLLSIPATLATLAQQATRPLAGFSSLHEIDAATAPDDADADRDTTGDDQMLEVHRGLHAKLIWARSTGGDHLWLGSANLTERAWGGENTEVALHLRVPPSVGGGLCRGLIEEISAEVAIGALREVVPPRNKLEERLDALRNRIAGAWRVTLIATRDGRELELRSHAPPLTETDDAHLCVRLLGAKDYHPWEPGRMTVRVPSVPLHQLTELVELKLSAGGSRGLSIGWVARAPLDPEPSLARDRAVLARLMGPRAFLAWLRGLLDEIQGEAADGKWPEGQEPPGQDISARPAPKQVLGSPTLEAVLRAWTRDPSAVRAVDRAIATWAADIRSCIAEDAEEEDRAALVELERFEKAWRIVRTGLRLDQEPA